MKDKISPIAFLIISVLIGLNLRVFWIAQANYVPGFHWEEYDTIHANLIEEDGINIYARQIATEPPSKWFTGYNKEPLCRRPIGYPLFLGGIYKLFGHSKETLWATNLGLYVLTCITIYLLGEAILKYVGVLSAFIFSVWPVSIYSVPMACDEHLFIPLWIFGIWLLVTHLNWELHKKYVQWNGPHITVGMKEL